MKPPNAGRKFPVEVLSRDEVERLLEACSKRGRAGVRDRALIAVLYRSGLRIAEALALEPRDVDLEAQTITIRHGKGNKRRVVGIDAATAAMLEKWMALRAAIGVRPRTGPLFCTISRDPEPGRPVQASVCRESLKRLAVKAGVEKRVHPHGFRHTNAAELAREGKPLTAIMRHLGHNDLETTYRYVNHLEPREVVDMTRGRQWIRGTEAEALLQASPEALEAMTALLAALSPHSGPHPDRGAAADLPPAA